MAFFLAPLVAEADVAANIGAAEGSISIAEAAAELIAEAMEYAKTIIVDIEAGLGDFLDLLSRVTMIVGISLILVVVIFIITTLLMQGGNLKTGIKNHVACGSKEFSYGADNFAFTFKVMWDCFWDKFVSFWNGQCTIYYIIDIVFGIVYGVTIELPVILIRAIFGINLQPIVNDIYEMVILPLNDLVYFVTGFYIVKWDKSVTDKCFRCKGIYQTSSGDDVVLYKTFNEWAQLNKCNVSQMKNGIVKMFESIIPSDKWSAWSNGQELPGYTNDPPF